MHRTVAKNASITFLSRILGFCRDIVMARYLGASWQLDAFLIVFKLPNFFRRLFAEGVFSQTLQPSVIHAENKVVFLQNVYTFIIAVVGSISIPFLLYPHKMLGIFVYGLDPNGQVYVTAARLMPWVFPYLACMAICGFYIVQLNLARRYAVGSLLPIVLNIFLMGGVLFYHWYADIWYVALSVLCAGVLQSFIAMCSVYRVGGVVWPVYHKNASIHLLLSKASIGFIAQLISYLSSCFDLFLVSFLTVGSLSWLYYAERLAYLPVGMVSVVLANILLTDLTQACRDKNQNKMAVILQQASCWVTVTAFPAMIGGYCLSEHIIALLFGSQYFQENDIIACAKAFKILSLTIPFLMMNRVWSVVPYAFLKPEKLLKISIVGFVCSATTSIVLLPYIGHLAIACGLFTSSVITSILLYQYINGAIQKSAIDTVFVKNAVVSAAVMILYLMIIECLLPLSIYYSKTKLLILLLIKGGVALVLFFLVFLNCIYFIPQRFFWNSISKK